MEINYKEILGAIALIIIIPQYFIYYRSILRGETKPHLYSKLIWWILMSIGFIIQLKGGGGPGTWVMGGTAFLQFINLLLSLKYGTKDITKIDKILLVLALVSICIYLGIDDKIYALFLVIFIDILGYIPTIRKTYNSPFTESIANWNISTFKYIISFFALSTYSIYTYLYPLVIIVFNTVLVLVMILGRKKITLKKHLKNK